MGFAGAIIGAVIQTTGTVAATWINAEAREYEVKKETQAKLTLGLAQQESELKMLQAQLEAQKEMSKEMQLQTTARAEIKAQTTRQITRSMQPLIILGGVAAIGLAAIFIAKGS